MPKNKRKAEEKLDYYREKIRRYENHVNNIDGGQLLPQEEYSPTGYTPCYDDPPAMDHEVIVQTINPETDSDDSEGFGDPAPQPVVQNVESDKADETTRSGESASQVSDVPLDPDILKALGEAINIAPEFGAPIHSNLPNLWSPILKKGLSKEGKDILVKEYVIPENCKLLLAPKLNAEIMAVISDLARNRDKKMSNSQQQLGISITAISRALTILINNEDKNSKLTAIKHLSDGCRLLCDLHYQETACRTKLVMPNLDQSFCKLMQDPERDQTLFGETLTEKIKASKAIVRQGLQIKKPTNNPKPSTSHYNSGRPTNVQGNWHGPPRSSNRGGGRGGRRPYGSSANHNSSRSAASQHQSQQLNTKPRTQQHLRR